MTRFLKLSQTIWHCQYHIVWVSKYRFRILNGKVGDEVENCIRAFSEQFGCEVIELNIQIDPVHGCSIDYESEKKNPFGVIIFGSEDTVLIEWAWIQRWSENM